MPISKWNIPTYFGTLPYTHTHTYTHKQHSGVASPFQKNTWARVQGENAQLWGGGFKLHITCQLLLPTTNNCQTQVVIIVYAQSTGKPVIDKKNKRKACMESRPNLGGVEGCQGLPSYCGTTWAPTILPPVSFTRVEKKGPSSRLQLVNPLGAGRGVQWHTSSIKLILSLVCRHWDTCHSCFVFLCELKETPQNNWGTRNQSHCSLSVLLFHGSQSNLLTDDKKTSEFQEFTLDFQQFVSFLGGGGGGGWAGSIGDSSSAVFSAPNPMLFSP